MDVKQTILSDFQVMLAMTQPYVLESDKHDPTSIKTCLRNVEQRAMQAGVVIKMPGSGISSDDKKKIDMYLGQIHTSIKSLREMDPYSAAYFSARMGDMSRSIQQGISIVRQL